jgi:putative peptide zinc metalloprotease protein
MSPRLSSSRAVRRLAALATGVLLLLGVAPAATAAPVGPPKDGCGPACRHVERGRPDNVAKVVNRKDGAVRYAGALSVQVDRDGRITETNTAVAYADCAGCATVAVALQVVLVEGSTTVVAPQNVADAVNNTCQSCVTYAAAKQLVFAVNGPVRLTPAGAERLRAVEASLRELGDRLGQLSVNDLVAEVDGLRNELADIFTTQLVQGDSERPAPGRLVAERATGGPAPKPV